MATQDAPISPSTFLSPRITADLGKSLDAIEGILLDGDAVAPLSPAAALARTLNTTTSTTANDNKSPSANYFLTNAVHIEVQENAKLPTFNLPVDRSNSSFQLPAPRGRRRRAAGGNRTISGCSVDFGSSAANTNTAANAPLSPLPKLGHHLEEHGPMDSPTSRAIDELIRWNENDMNLSELFLDGQDRSSAALAYSHSSGGIPMMPLATSLSSDTPVATNDKTKSTVKKTENGSHQNATSTSFAPGTVFGPHPNNSNAKMLPYKREKPLPIPGPNLKEPHAATIPNTQKKANPVKSAAAMAHATGQRSKFGFGGDHKVPSVPAPPPNFKGYDYAVASAAGKPKPSIPQRRTFIPSTKGLPKEVGTVIAYERKKQRAKDARVKLNEAMEELAVAIELAGSQSKERFDYIANTTGTNNAHMTNGQPPPGPPQHPLARLMDETIQHSASAKKWDRPAFVGVSASIIHSLNAQCEGLMREVAQLRKSVKKQASCAAITCDSMTSLSSDPDSHISEQAAKKRKLEPEQATMATKEEQRCLAIHNTVETPNLLKNIASFLDPSSLCKCICVSKTWRTQNIFDSTQLWLNLCNKRFGEAAVKKWQEDNKAMGKKHTSSGNLYRHMSGVNVKPYSRMEGSLLLGGSSLNGVVSCWASLVDRSNGETSRSVKQQKIQHNGETRDYYQSMPVVEIRLLVQNTGYSKGAIIIPEQQFSVDASTRRKGDKMIEVDGDKRFKRQVLHVDRRPSIDGKPDLTEDKSLSNEMCKLGLFETAVLSLQIHAKGCSSTVKFCTRSKKIQLLVSIDGTTRPLVIPFEASVAASLK